MPDPASQPGPGSEPPAPGHTPGSGPSRWLRIGEATLLPVVFFLCELVGLTTYPLVWGDEALLNDPALQLVRYGVFRSDVLSALPNYQQFYFWQPPGLGLVTSLSYLLFGFGVWQTRLPGLVFGALAVGLVQNLATLVFKSRHAGIVAAVLLIVWPPFVLTTRSARMDTPCLALLLLATVVLLRDGSGGSIGRSGLAGLFTGLAGMMHSLALPWMFGLLLLHVRRADRLFARVGVFMGMAALPLAVWLWFATRFPAEFRDQFLVQLSGRTAGSPWLSRPWEELLRSGRDYATLPSFFLALLLAGYVLLSRPSFRQSARDLIVLGIGVFAGVAFLAGKHSGYYNLYYTVPLLVIIAGGIIHGATEPPASRTLRLALLTCGGLLLLNCAAKIYVPRAVAVLYQAEARDYDQAFAPLSRLLRPGDQVWGAGEAWYACIRAGARLDIAPDVVPVKGQSLPDPTRHHYAVVSAPQSQRLNGFSRIAVVDRTLPSVLGHTFSNASYRYEIWASDRW